MDPPTDHRPWGLSTALVATHHRPLRTTRGQPDPPPAATAWSLATTGGVPAPATVIRPHAEAPARGPTTAAAWVVVEVGPEEEGTSSHPGRSAEGRCVRPRSRRGCRWRSPWPDPARARWVPRGRRPATMDTGPSGNAGCGSWRCTRPGSPGDSDDPRTPPPARCCSPGHTRSVGGLTHPSEKSVHATVWRVVCGVRPGQCKNDASSSLVWVHMGNPDAGTPGHPHEHPTHVTGGDGQIRVVPVREEVDPGHLPAAPGHMGDPVGQEPRQNGGHPVGGADVPLLHGDELRPHLVPWGPAEIAAPVARTPRSHHRPETNGAHARGGDRAQPAEHGTKRVVNSTRSKRVEHAR